jgi:iron complex outermembrane receptor protein
MFVRFARSCGALRTLAVASLFLFLPGLAAALDARLLLPDGSPAAGYQVSLVGQSGAVLTDADGRFRIHPTPALPFLLVATDPSGGLSAPIEVAALQDGPLELRLAAQFEDAITVVSGVVANLDAPPAAGTTTIGEEDLEQRHPQRLFETLDNVAGVSRTDETTTGVPVLRGLGRGRTLVLFDGNRVTTERRAGASASFLDPFLLAAVEVARGAGAVSYGSDALGGVIDARPRYPEPGNPTLRFEGNQTFGRSDDSSLGLEGSRDLFGGALLGAVTWRKGDESEVGGGDPLTLAFFEDKSGSLRYSRPLSSGRLRVGLYGAEATDVGKPASDSATIPTVYPLERARRFNAGFESAPVGGWDSLEGSVFLGTYRLVLDRDRVAALPTTRLLETSDVESNDGSLRFMGSRSALGGRLQLGSEFVSRFGLQAITRQRNFDAAGNPTGTVSTLSIDDAYQRDAAVFMTFDRPLAARALFSAGLRGDQVESRNKGGFFGDRDTSHGALSGQAGLTVGPFNHLTTSLQVARGFRDPTLSDRYFRGPSGRGIVVGNPDLDPESSLQVDAAVRWAAGRTSVSLFGYHYKIDDLVERFREGRDFFFRNRGEATVKGVELEAQALLPLGLSLEVAAALARGEANDGSNLADIAAPNASATLRWAGERGYAFLRGLAVQKDDRPGPAEVARPGHSRWDLGLGVKAFRGLELRLVGRNLTDHRYRDGGDEVASLAVGRTLTLGVVGRY